MAAMGLCFGLGFWTTPLTLAFAAPAALWLGLRIRQGRALLCGVAGVVVGASPWLWANVHTGFASLERQQVLEGTVASRYVDSFTRLLPAVAGSPPASTQGRAIAVLCSLTILAGLAVALWRRNTAIAMLCVSALLVPAVVAASNVSVDPSAGRYATLMVPALTGVLAWALARTRIVAATVVALAMLWTVTTLWRASDGLSPVAHPTVSTQISQLASYLEGNGQDAVWADYWVSYLLSAATQERIIAAAVAPQVFRREPSYETAAMRPSHTAIVLFAGQANDRTLLGEPRLPRHERRSVGPFAVWVYDGRVDVPNLLTAIALP
jgi:hypothetical protein